MARIDWRQGPVDEAVHEAAVKRLARAAMTVTTYARRQMSRSSGVSKAGEYPYKQTGHLRRNVIWEIDERRLVARVGTNVPYGRTLELYRNRPWLSRAIAETAREVQRILGGKV